MTISTTTISKKWAEKAIGLAEELANVSLTNEENEPEITYENIARIKYIAGFFSSLETLIEYEENLNEK